MSKPIHILFVEDDPEMLAIYRENFFHPDFEIATAANAERALQLLRTSKSQFDVVVTDNHLPGMSGMSLLKQLKHNDPGIKLLMVTGYASGIDHLLCQNPAMKFVDKPVKMADLKLMIEELIA